MSELVIPVMIPFPTIIYEPILVLSILTWSLRDRQTDTHTETQRHDENITSTAYAGGYYFRLSEC